MADVADPHLQRLSATEQVLGHRFADTALLLKACTHASRCGAQASAETRRHQANERLEFLGDALFGAALCHLLFQRMPNADEGELSRWKGALASREALAQAISGTGLLEHCLVGSQLGAAGPTSWPVSVRANFCEALLAAVYLDGGWPALMEATSRLIGPALADPTHGIEDPRMRLQSWCLAKHAILPTYVCQRDGGTDHEPNFTATASIAGHSASGFGSSRRRAEAAAATTLLHVLHASTNQHDD